MSDYTCPRHRDKPLAEDADGLRCPECGKQYPIKNGLPVFVFEDVYWGEFPPEVSEELLERAETAGWKAAVDVILSRRPDMQEYILDSRRANHLHLVPTTHRGRILDIGTGWGCIAASASKLFENVYTVEAVPVRARFSHARFSQERLDNIHLAQASIFDLPFPDGFFDVVHLNGVLEWIGDWNRSLPPRDAQLEILRMMRRLLRPGGILVVGIENRLGYSYLLGRKDHKDVWGTNLLPRFLANLVFRWRLKDEYRVYTYSMPGYQDLISEAEYDETVFFAPWPNYNRPFQLVSLHDPAGFDDFLSRRGGTSLKRRIGLPVARLANRAGLLKHVVPDFFIFARR